MSPVRPQRHLILDLGVPELDQQLPGRRFVVEGHSQVYPGAWQIGVLKRDDLTQAPDGRLGQGASASGVLKPTGHDPGAGQVTPAVLNDRLHQMQGADRSRA